MSEDISELILRRRRQFLVHSFLYYVLDESIISDATYDKWCVELVELQRKYPSLAKKLPYHNLCIQLDESASGGYIGRDDYPPEIVSTAFHLLATERKVPVSELVRYYGYYIVGGDKL
jgi:hypothetical protein